jgi:hypothetical protein
MLHAPPGLAVRILQAGVEEAAALAFALGRYFLHDLFGWLKIPRHVNRWNVCHQWNIWLGNFSHHLNGQAINCYVSGLHYVRRIRAGRQQRGPKQQAKIHSHG